MYYKFNKTDYADARNRLITRIHGETKDMKYDLSTITHWLLSAIIFSLCIQSECFGKLEVLNTERMLLTGSIQRSDVDQMVKIAESGELPSTLIVACRGAGRTAWETVHEMSKFLESQDVTVEIIYAEDAAIAIGGRKTIYKGTLIAYNPVDINRNSSLSTRVWTYERTPNGSRQTLKTVTESLSPTIDRFDMACKGRIPREADDLGNEPWEIAGKNDRFTGRKGVKDEHNDVWYYKRTGSRGRWSHDEPTKIRDMIEKSRKDMERKLNLIRRSSKKR